MHAPPRLVRWSLRGTGRWLTVLGLASLFLWAVTGSPPAEAELRRWHGPLEEVHLGGPGHATWLAGVVDGELLRFRSFHGREWPGMETLERGTLVDLAYARDPVPDRRRRGPRFWIFALERDGRAIVRYDDVASLWTRDRRWLVLAGGALLGLGLTLLQLREPATRGPAPRPGHSDTAPATHA